MMNKNDVVEWGGWFATLVCWIFCGVLIGSCIDLDHVRFGITSQEEVVPVEDSLLDKAELDLRTAQFDLRGAIRDGWEFDDLLWKYDDVLPDRIRVVLSDLAWKYYEWKMDCCKERMRSAIRRIYGEENER